jgi:hypothetical protein
MEEQLKFMEEQLKYVAREVDKRVHSDEVPIGELTNVGHFDKSPRIS